ncbi:hypothetical protein [Streptosporangium sp. KLBMP 9127]|nr:hypothetical protein [Streptosporangium sp. KLBMP 9127]
MFELLSKLAEIFSSYGQQYFTGRRGAKDARVAQCLLDVILTLQELVARGERILFLAEDPDKEFADALKRQVDGLEALRAKLEDARALLTTIDVEFYLDLVVFIDVKSGLLKRWTQQATRSAYSTTTLFFLPSEHLSAALESGRSYANAQGMGLDRSDYLFFLAERLAQVRATEIRDIRRVSGAELGPEIGAARTRLDGARKLCRSLLESMEQALGAEALARLRRDLAR